MVILDTNVVSELIRPVPFTAVARWFSKQHSETLHITTITVAEILYGIELLAQGARRSALLAGAETMFTRVFVGRILGFETDAAYEFPRITGARRRRGMPMAEFDGQIAAIAKVNGASLATRNTNDFAGCGLRLLNPWLD